MKRLLLVTVSMAALTGATRAADMPTAMPGKAQMYSPVPPATWDGAYFGVQGGVAQNYAVFRDSNCFLPGCPLIDHRTTGGTAGGLLGYNWQQGNFVYGVEGDWSWLGTKTSEVAAINTNAGLATSFDVKWLATLRGRAGLALDSVLVYVTGGAAFGNVKNSIDRFAIVDPTLRASFSQNQTKAGWTAGVGAEYMLSSHWTARAEFRYVDLGKTNVACSSAIDAGHCVSAGYRGEFGNTLKLGLVGLNYKF